MAISKHEFIQMINDNRGIIMSVCKAYYPDGEDQKDALQDVILQLWKSYDTFRGEAKVCTWIYKVSLNTLLTKLRSDQKKVATASISIADKLPVVMADDDLELLKSIISSLKELDKAIVILYLEGYKNKEISNMLNLTPTNVSTRLNRIKAELKEKFKRAHYELK